MKLHFMTFTFMLLLIRKSQIKVHSLNVVAVVAEKDVDSLEEKNRRLFPETESFG